MHSIFILILFSIANGQPNSDDHRPASPIPKISGLLERMLQSSGFKAQPPTRQVAINFTLTPNQMNKIAELTNITRFRQILAPILIPRVVGSKEHYQVEKYIQKTLTDLKFNVEIDEFEDDSPIGVKTFRNIIATFDPNVEKRLLLACHYDSKILEGEIFVAATDSAVPCAIMLDIAKTIVPLLKQNAAVTLQLVFFDGEEAFGNWSKTDSIYGSRHLAKLWSQKPWESKSELERINAFVLLDLLGAKEPKIVHTMGHGTKHLFDKIVQIENELNKTNKLKKIDKIFHSFEILGPIEDDHMPFRARRVPIMHLITFEFPPGWHTVKDNEKSLDMDTIFNLLSILRVFVASYLGLTI